MRNSSRYLENIVNLVYPRRCPICDDVVSLEQGLICGDCRRKIKYIEEPRCRKCGKQMQDENTIFCKDCEKRRHEFEYGFALYDYQSMKNSIYRFKYSNRSEYAKYYARDIYEHLRSEISAIGADALVPVPLHVSRRTRRGYNQAEVLTKELSKLTGIPCYSNLVKRVKNTVPQKELDVQERQNNLKKAFLIHSDVVKLNKTIVVDDIYTTGSTIDAVAKGLRQHGVGKVYYLTLCIGEGM
ncbi:MAG: ComF family protein [Lachnospiraceae bacterium]|nr:ComF family protein [Lachnospiraceae bacterium]